MWLTSYPALESPKLKEPQGAVGSQPALAGCSPPYSLGQVLVTGQLQRI